MKNHSATASATEALAAGERGFVHLWNKGPNTVYLRYDGDTSEVTTSIGFPVAADAGLFLNNDGMRNPFIHAIRAICDTSETAEIAIQTDGNDQS